jgi:hypothetical protein
VGVGVDRTKLCMSNNELTSVMIDMSTNNTFGISDNMDESERW